MMGRLDQRQRKSWCTVGGLDRIREIDDASPRVDGSLATFGSR